LLGVVCATQAACSGGKEVSAPSGATSPTHSVNAEARPAPVAPVDDPAQKTPLVVFLGDSISAGLDVAAEDAFPAQLQRKLATTEAAFRLVNAGVSGDTTAGGLRRLDWLLAQKPAVVVVELGANDGLRGGPHAEIERNLREILAKVRAGGAAPLLLGMRLPPSYGPDYEAGFEALYVRLAEELRVAFVPYFMAGVAGVPERNQPDGLHPTPQGHTRLADNVAPALRALLTAPRAP